MNENDKIDRKKALRYMGFPRPDAADEQTLSILSECEKELLEAARPLHASRVFDIERREDGILLSKTQVLLTGKSIEKHLSGCQKAAVICSTLGVSADRYISRCQLRGAIYGLCADALASAYVEKISDAARKELEKKLALSVNFVFAAGYGDFPLETVPRLLELVNAPKTIGVTTLKSLMLTPVKSIVGVSGISGGS